MTLVEAGKLSNDEILIGVLEEIVYESALMTDLPFIEILGNGLTYNRESTLGSVDFYDVGDTWVESTPTFDQHTATLKILGGDADVDKFLKATRSNIQDLEAAIIALKAKGFRHKFEEMLIYGDNTTNSKQFDGIRLMIDTTTASDQVLAMSATGTTLTLAYIDALVDMVKPGKPDAFIMSRRSRRKIKALTRLAGFNLETDRNSFGLLIENLQGIPFWVNDWVLDTHTVAGSVETATTGQANSVIYAVKIGEGEFAGLTAPGGVMVEPIGTLESKDADRTRIKGYMSTVLFRTLSAAALIGVQD